MRRYSKLYAPLTSRLLAPFPQRFCIRKLRQVNVPKEWEERIRQPASTE